MPDYIDLRSFDRFAKDAERVLRQLEKYGKATSSNTGLPRLFGMKANDLINSGMLDIATTNYRKKGKKVLFQTGPDVCIKTIGFRWYFSRLKL